VVTASQARRQPRRLALGLTLLRRPRGRPLARPDGHYSSHDTRQLQRTGLAAPSWSQQHRLAATL